MSYTDDDYILFIGQECNFQTRSLLIPIKHFLLVREEEYNIMKNNKKSIIFKKGINEIVINNILTNNYKCDNDTIKYQEQKLYTKICNILMEYAFGMEKNCYIDVNDKIWYDNSFGNICKGFDHIKNYLNCLTMNSYNNKKINIVDSYLFLETKN